MSWNQIEVFHTIPSVIHLPFLISSCSVCENMQTKGTFQSHIIIFISWWFSSSEMWQCVTGQAANYSPSNTASHRRRTESSAALLWESQILHSSFHRVMYRFMISQIKPYFWTTEPCPFCNRSNFNYEEVLSKNIQICVL